MEKQWNAPTTIITTSTATATRIMGDILDGWAGAGAECSGG